MPGFLCLENGLHERQALLPVHPDELIQQPILGLHVGGIPEDAVQKAQTLMPVLLPVHPHKLFHQLLFGFHVGGIPDDAVDGQTLMQVGFS